MTTKNYKDYTIAVSKIMNESFGAGFRAWFFVKKNNGMKECTQCYETYRRKTYKAVFDDVANIIDALG